MATVEATESEFEMVPEGDIVKAKVKSIEGPVTIQWGDKSFERFNWKFEITEGEYKGFHINDGTSPKFSVDPPSKLYEWACMLLGRTFEVGETFDTDDLVGLPCRIEVGYKPDKEDPNKFWMRVETLMPATGSTASAEDVFG